ncbi:hypothetical protein CTheo_9172 [Ceratobasidium theobromae]|uniref:Uncharacterized protein n=1 Tax=Ceratobasidium theobromae TaxID=1582974 RepID=A0A5N5Q600_9AGAM|nr:hypothetical protein CTheo_9172 [Ceratobasidium theobromae]
MAARAWRLALTRHPCTRLPHTPAFQCLHPRSPTARMPARSRTTCLHTRALVHIPDRHLIVRPRSPLRPSVRSFACLYARPHLPTCSPRPFANLLGHLRTLGSANTTM